MTNQRSQSEQQTLAGFAPSTIVLFVAATCLLGLVWGVYDSNWVLVATEFPAVLALVGVWAFARANESGNRVALIASALGALCAVEVWIATAVLEARGLELAILVAFSTGLTVAVLAGWGLWRHHRSTSQPARS